MKMRSRAVLGTAVLFLLSSALQAQETQDLLKSYRRNFAIASLDVKIQIVQDAGASGKPEMGPLYQEAVEYVLENYSYLDTDQRFRALGVSAVEKIKAAGYSEARHTVWKLFQTDTAMEVRSVCLDALSVIGKGDPEVVPNINHWLAAQNTVFQTGKLPDLPVIMAGVKALGALADGSSFPVLFSAMTLGYTADITAQARASLLAIPGDQKALFLNVLQNSPLPEKREALKMALESNRLSESDKGAVAEMALDVGLHTAAADSQLKALAREIRFAAAKALAERKWAKATPLAIEHFDTLLLEYERGQADRQFLIEAIDLLGSMNSHEAAVRLTQYLILINSYTEKLREFDGAIVLSVIQNLGRLGDKVAFDDLMYVEYLNYSGEIKGAARKVRGSLKW